MDSKEQRSRVSRRWSRPLQGFFARRPAVLRCEEVTAPSLAPPPAEPAPSGSDGGNAKEVPLQFEMFSREWQNASGQDNWDGFRIEAVNQVNKCLSAAHSLFLGTQIQREQNEKPPGYIYQFGPGYQSEDSRTIMMARADLNGTINGRLIKKMGDSFELKTSTASHLKDPQKNMQEVSLEYTGGDWTTSGKLAWQGAWIFGGSYSQLVLSQLQVGGDITMIPLPNGVMSTGQVGMRWALGPNSFCGTVARAPNPASPTGGSAHDVRFQYMRSVSERLSLGSELKISHPDESSGMSLAYEYIFRQARIQGSIDTDGKVSCCVNDGSGFGFNGSIDYAQGDYKFGVLMQVLPQQEPPPQ